MGASCPRSFSPNPSLSSPNELAAKSQVTEEPTRLTPSYALYGMRELYSTHLESVFPPVSRRHSAACWPLASCFLLFTREVLSNNGEVCQAHSGWQQTTPDHQSCPALHPRPAHCTLLPPAPLPYLVFLFLLSAPTTGLSWVMPRVWKQSLSNVLTLEHSSEVKRQISQETFRRRLGSSVLNYGTWREKLKQNIIKVLERSWDQKLLKYGFMT